MENQFKEEILQLEKQKNMPYVTNIERMGKEEGIQIGLEEGARLTAQEMIKDTLLLRFGEVPNPIIAKVESVSDLTILKQCHRLALTCPSLDEFIQQLE